jgi:hypothetical protein
MDKNYQHSHFSVIEGGLYTAYVRSKNDCGEDTQNHRCCLFQNWPPNNDESTDTFYVRKGMIYYPKQTLEYLIWKVVGVINEF